MKRAVAAIIKHGDKILLAKRSLKSRGQVGKWENAGGEIDENETPEEAVKREIMEELGVVFNPEKIVIEDDFDNVDGKWHVTLYIGTIVGEPKVMIEDETSEICWFNISDLVNVDLATYTRTDFVRLGWIENLS